MVLKLKPIIPKELDVKAMVKIIEKDFFEFVDGFEEDFEKTTKTWKNGDIFDREEEKKPKFLRGEVSTDDDRYRYLNDGTKSHFVKPVRAKALVFSEGYKRKNKPRFIGSMSGGPFGKKVFSKGHFVKGIEKHELDETIKKKNEPLFEKTMEKAMKKARKVSDNPI